MAESIPKSGYVNGSDLLLLVGTKAIGSCTSHTFTFNTETKEIAVKPPQTAGLSSGLWKKKIVTALSYSIKAEGLRFYDETEYGYADLLAAWKAGAPVTVKGIERASSAGYIEGKCVITSLEENAPAQDNATYSVSLESAEEPSTFDTSKITVNVAS